jgi:hypothetical protein
MATAMESHNPIPVICVDASSVAGAEIFNPNSWSGGSKGLVQSCWTEYSVLHHCVTQLSAMCDGAERLLAKNFETLQQQWRMAKFDLLKLVFFAQQPDLHIRIEAFFSGVKTLLDLIVQLLTTERIVAATVDGFHRDQNGYGGRVLNALRNNAMKERKNAATKLDALISEHKKAWIDQVIFARDQLIHPEKGMYQLMFTLELSERDGQLILTKAHPPEIGSRPMQQFAHDTLKGVTSFSESFLGLLHVESEYNP